MQRVVRPSHGAFVSDDVEMLVVHFGITLNVLRAEAPEQPPCFQLVFSAAALGTQKLLHKLKGTGSLPNVSDRLGELSRTNSEAILAMSSRDLPYTRSAPSFHLICPSTALIAYSVS